MTKREECIQFIIEVLDNQIENSLSRKLHTEKLLGMVKAKYLVENFGKIEYEGNLFIQAAVKHEDFGADAYDINICFDEISVGRSGYIIGPYGSDSNCKEYLFMTKEYLDIDDMNNLNSFYFGFDQFSINQENITIEDNILNFYALPKSID